MEIKNLSITASYLIRVLKEGIIFLSTHSTVVFSLTYIQCQYSQYSWYRIMIFLPLFNFGSSDLIFLITSTISPVPFPLLSGHKTSNKTVFRSKCFNEIPAIRTAAGSSPGTTWELLCICDYVIHTFILSKCWRIRGFLRYLQSGQFMLVSWTTWELLCICDYVIHTFILS